MRRSVTFAAAGLLLAAALHAQDAERGALPAATAPEGMALIPAGEFTMGRTKTTSDDPTGMRPLILRDDRPPHAVRLDAFYLDRHEVTHAEYARFLEAAGRRAPYHWLDGAMPDGRGDFPIYNVDWDDATAYCAWNGKRLPTEAEWEKAARGGLDGADYPWGDDKADDSRARFGSSEGPGPVGKYPPNEYGLFDMAGGVSEWCADWFEREYYEKSPAENPPGPAEGQYRIIRGGSWADGPRRVTVFFRNWVRPNQRTPNLGFRCAKDAE